MITGHLFDYQLDTHLGYLPMVISKTLLTFTPAFTH